jgi:hypothetical protein
MIMRDHVEARETLDIHTDAPRVTQDSTYANSTLRKLFHKAHNKVLKMQKILHYIWKHKVVW